jgi:hypothetical protein
VSVVGRAAAREAERLGLFGPVKWYLRATPRTAAAKAETVLFKSPAVIARTRRIVEAGQRLVGSLRWRGGTQWVDETGQFSEKTIWGRDNDFARWMRGGPEPGPSSTMPCAETLMYVAHRAGAVDEATLKRIYAKAADAVSASWRKDQDEWAANRAAWRVVDDHLLRGERTPFEIDPETGIGGPDIPAGHTVSVGGGDHFMLSLGTRDAEGRQEVLSNWTHPHRIPSDDAPDHPYGYLQRTSVEEVVESASKKLWGYVPPIESAAPSWLL